MVDPRVMQGNAPVNLHQMPGSHSLDQLTKTITAQLSASRDGDQIRVQVAIANRAAGHYVPTGSPLRRLLLDVRADSYAGRHFLEHRVHGRRMADESATQFRHQIPAMVSSNPADARVWT